MELSLYSVWEPFSKSVQRLQKARMGREQLCISSSLAGTYSKCMGFPGGAESKESTCQCRRYKRGRFDPWVGRIPWRRAWRPTLVFFPGESHGQRSLVGYSPWSCKELDMTEWLSMHAPPLSDIKAQCPPENTSDRSGRALRWPEQVSSCELNINWAGTWIRFPCSFYYLGSER